MKPIPKISRAPPKPECIIKEEPYYNVSAAARIIEVVCESTVRQIASEGIWRSERTGRAIGKVLEFGINVFESLFAPILTPEQKPRGEIAQRERREAAEQAERERRNEGRDR
jgi:hypothetical protein